MPGKSIPQLALNSLWSSENIWWHRSRSTSAHVMTCYLMASSHHLNQCWLLVSEVLWLSSKAFISMFPRYYSVSFKIFIFKISAPSPRGQWLDAKRCPDQGSPRHNLDSTVTKPHHTISLVSLQTGTQFHMLSIGIYHTDVLNLDEFQTWSVWNHSVVFTTQWDKG